MHARLGLGPVFAYEWLRLSRRWQMYALRSLFVAGLLLGIYLAWLETSARPSTSVLRAQARLGEVLFYTVIGIQLTLVLLAAPAATAGAICLDKARGTLLHVLVTDLSSAEIVLGKLAARLLPAVGLVGCAVPVLFLCIFFGGIDPEALIGAELVTLGVVVLSCALAFFLSVYGRKTFDVLLVVYFFWILELLGYPILAYIWDKLGMGLPPTWILDLNPYWIAYLPYLRPGSTTLEEPAWFAAGCMGLAAMLAAWAALRMRAVTIRQSSRADRAPRQRRRWRLGLFLPSLDRNPVLWREWQGRRLTGWGLGIWSIYFAASGFFTFAALFEIYQHGAGIFGMIFPAFVNAFQISIGMLFLSVIAVTSLSEERVRGSLDVLLATPLSTWKIVWGKWWGAYRTALHLAVFPMLLATGLAFYRHWFDGIQLWYGVAWTLALMLAYGAFTTSIGLALATMVARPGLAIGWSVAVYVFQCIGWILILAMSAPRGPSSEGLLMASPFYGGGVIASFFGGEQHQIGDIQFWWIVWIVIFAILAILIYLVVVLSFDHFFERMDHRRGGQVTARPRPALPTATAPAPTPIDLRS